MKSICFSLKSLGKKRSEKKTGRYYVNESRLHTRKMTRDTPPHIRCVHEKGGGACFWKRKSKLIVRLLKNVGIDGDFFRIFGSTPFVVVVVAWDGRAPGGLRLFALSGLQIADSG